MTRTALFIGLMASPALADDARIWAGAFSSPAYVRMHEPTVPNAIATVTFRNENVHSANEDFPLTWGGITIGVDFEWNVDALGSERITVEAPDGYVAIPRSITVGEQQSGVIHIVEWLGG